MKSVIFDALYEHIDPNQDGNCDWCKLMDTVVKNDELITKKISDDKELLQLYNELKNALDGVAAEETEAYFVRGFSLGLRFGEEAARILK